MRLMQRSWAALLVCATVWLVSCVDDNSVVPDQTYNTADTPVMRATTHSVYDLEYAK